MRPLCRYFAATEPVDQIVSDARGFGNAVACPPLRRAGRGVERELDRFFEGYLMACRDNDRRDLVFGAYKRSDGFLGLGIMEQRNTSPHHVRRGTYAEQ